MRFYAYKQGNGLVPADAESQAVFDQLRRANSPYRVDAVLGRSNQHNRWFWLFASRVAENMAGDWTSEGVVEAMKVVTGHCTWVELGDGTRYPRPKSINFDKMDQTAFNAFTEACIKAVCQSIAPGMDPAAWADIEEILSK